MLNISMIVRIAHMSGHRIKRRRRLPARRIGERRSIEKCNAWDGDGDECDKCDECGDGDW